MSEQLKPKTLESILAISRKDGNNIPVPCQYGSLCLNDNRRIRNENINWLTERNDKIPIWSRLKTTNCVGHQRNMGFNKLNNYDIEIPSRLYSLFGDSKQHLQIMEQMQKFEKYQLINCVLALCAALKFNFTAWFSQLLDTITNQGAAIYKGILKNHNLTSNEFSFKHLNNLYYFEETTFQVQLQLVASGYVYIRFGLNEFNLARALIWFFRYYQFGILYCYNRSIAFGYTVDSENGFFMYDYHSKGFPLFEEQQLNSYILRTNHLQVLLYCLVVTLNVTMDMVKFHIYNADVRIEDSKEKRMLKNETKNEVQFKNENTNSKKTKNTTAQNYVMELTSEPSRELQVMTSTSNNNNNKTPIMEVIGNNLTTTSNQSNQPLNDSVINENKNECQPHHAQTKTKPPLIPPKPKIKFKSRENDIKAENEVIHQNHSGPRVYVIDNSNSDVSKKSQNRKIFNVVYQLKDLIGK